LAAAGNLGFGNFRLCCGVVSSLLSSLIKN